MLPWTADYHRQRGVAMCYSLVIHGSESFGPAAKFPHLQPVQCVTWFMILFLSSPKS